MRLEYYPLEKLKQQLIDIISVYPDLLSCKLFFFGSRVTGYGTDRSDIDLGIEGKSPISAKTLIEIEERIENLPTLYKIELVDFCCVSDNFRKVALRKIELIN